MELSFSRGFSPGWLGGCDHKMLVPGLSSAKRGVLLGEGRDVRGERRSSRLRRPVAPGDGVVFAGNREEGDEQGGRVYEVITARRRRHELAFGRGAIDFGQLRVGQSIWKTDDPQLTARLRKTFTGESTAATRAAGSQVEAAVGDKLRVIRPGLAMARVAGSSTSEPLAAAVKHPLTEDVLKEQLGRLGGTVYELRNLSAQIAGEPMAPLSVLGKLRHEMVRFAIALSACRRGRFAETSVSELGHRWPKPQAAGDAIGRRASRALSVARSIANGFRLRCPQRDG